MTDRELLELAAKAAGIPVSGEWLAFTDVWCGLRVREDDNPGGYCWNPLDDDAQALRLAVKLRINIYNPPDTAREPLDARTSASIYLADIDHVIYFNEDARDTAATRRAIVRAAAEIGKAA